MKSDYIEEKIKEEVTGINISDKIDDAIAAGIYKGKSEKEASLKVVPMKKKFRTSMVTRVAASIALTIIILGGIGNLSPEMASAMDRIPVVGSFVRLLIFVDHEVDGGVVTDGTNLDRVASVETEKGESLFIHFMENDENQLTAAAYNIQYFKNPDLLSFTVSGVRMTDMTNDFEGLLASPYVKDIYMVMTLDDSMVRFNILLEDAVNYDILEHENPAMLEIQLSSESEAEEVGKPLYTVRSYSYEKSERFAIIEERFMHLEGINYRIIKDRAGKFVYEFGRFGSYEEAERLLKRLPQTLDLLITQEKSNDLPSYEPDVELIEQTQETREVEEKSSETVGKNVSSNFAVSISHDDYVAEATITLNETSMSLYDREGELMHTLIYEDCTFVKSKGEASFILTVTVNEDRWDVRGVYNDFFDVVNEYLATPIQ